MIVQPVVEPMDRFTALISTHWHKYLQYLLLSPSISLSVPGSCGVSATRFTSACSLPSVWRTWPGSVSFSARYLCISTISIYLRVYLSIYLLGLAGPGPVPGVPIFPHLPDKLLLIDSRLPSTPVSYHHHQVLVGENVYISSMQCQCSTDIFS